MTRLAFVPLLLFCLTPAGAAPPRRAAHLPMRLQPLKPWRFAVSGDSRNCGDIVMPAIAAGVRASQARFYWHLGDFRWNTHIDEDFAHDSDFGGRTPTEAEYREKVWRDFIDRQLKPFSPVPVYLTIGNHELYGRTREDYETTFKLWLARGRGEETPRTYYAWRSGAVAFLALDNASHDQFDEAQLAWFERALAADVADPAVKTIVVGMHSALPDSIAFDHSMSEYDKPVAIESGRKVYAALLKARDDAHKNVYVLASHSHYFMDGIFNTPYWRAHGGVLPGWIVGTAGAVRYPLPPAAKDANKALTAVYGYLLASVNPKDGTITFGFRKIAPDAIPADVTARYGEALVKTCFEKNIADWVPGKQHAH